MKIIFYNLKNFMNRNLLFFLLVVVNIFASAIVMSFSYGLYQHYNAAIGEGEREVGSDETVLFIRFNNKEERYATKKMIADCIMRVPPAGNNGLLYYSADGACKIEERGEEKDIISFFHFAIDDDGKLIYSDFVANNIKRALADGRLFTDEEYKSGAKVAVVNARGVYENTKLGDKIVVDGTEYEIIGRINGMANDFIIPFSVTSDDMKVDGLMALYSRVVMRSQHAAMKKTFESYFGDMVSFPDGEYPSPDEIYYYKTILAVAALIALVAAMNFAVLYRFILMKRQKDLAIYRIVGCTRKKAELFYLGECGIITVPLFALALLAYDKLLLPPLSGIFEYMPDAYSPKIYLYLFAIYMAISAITVWIMMRFSVTNKTILEIRRGAK